MTKAAGIYLDQILYVANIILTQLVGILFPL
jgi:hypothetical protein